MKVMQKYNWIKAILAYGTVLCCTVVLVSLCFNEGLDYDEAFSYSIIRDNTFWGIPGGLLDSSYNDVIPLWYMLLKAWTILFGDSFVVCKMFTVAGSVATMLLGASIVRRNWGLRTAILFIIPAGLAPSLMHVGVNIRTYSWTVFLITACALTAYELAGNSDKLKLWFALFLLTAAGLFCHHFTAFNYLFIYLYLFESLFRRDKKKIWKMMICGIGALVPFSLWLIVSDFFSLTETAGAEVGSKVDLYELFQAIFETTDEWSMEIGVGIFALTIVMFVLLGKRFQEGERGFVWLCLFSFIASYVLSALLASASSHFIVPRHTMHAMALLWLGIAVVLPRINKAAFLSGLLYLIAMCGDNYDLQYNWEYATIPYLEETKEFIAENMETGDIVISNVDGRFATVYGCYMPEQEFLTLWQMTDDDIQALTGKRVWFFLCNSDFFTEAQQEKYHIVYENRGHYGFQIIDNCTDFDLLWIEIQGTSDNL